MYFRYFIMGLVVVHLFVCGTAIGQCEWTIDPNAFDPNSFRDSSLRLDNGQFECGCSALTSYKFTPSIIWKRIPHPESTFQLDCYAGIHSSFSPEGRWEITAPYEGDTFIVLSTGGFESTSRMIPDVTDANVKGSQISQKIELSQGDTILGAYFFGTADYLNFNDYGQISLELIGEPNDFPGIAPSFVIPPSYCDIEIVGNHESTLLLSPETGGWIPFSYTVEPNQVGPYYIRCEVMDTGDNVVNSYYAVDGLRICKGGISQADLNLDCDVNIEDFSMLSQAWLTFCPDPPINDPNFPGDPNDFPQTDPNLITICESADFDKSWYIDVNDIIIMTDEWLQ